MQLADVCHSWNLLLPPGCTPRRLPPLSFVFEPVRCGSRECRREREKLSLSVQKGEITQNYRPVDQGAYTCEAINVKGRVLATPDCIVRIVNIPAPPPPTAPPIRQQQPSCDPRGSAQVYPDQSGRCQCKVTDFRQPSPVSKKPLLIRLPCLSF